MEEAFSGSPVSFLPSYRTPPINEVVCGVRFEPLEGFTIPHFGVFWSLVRDRYPIAQHAPPLAAPGGKPQYFDPASQLPLPRVWLIAAADNQVLQIFPDGFFFNWRQRGDVYPRYSRVIENFEVALKSFEDYLSTEKLGPLRFIEWELTYINNVPKGEAWETPADFGKLFTEFVWHSRGGRFLPSPRSLAWQCTFPLPEKQGNLTCNLSMGRRRDDNVEILVFQLSSKGMGADSTHKGIRPWVDLAHEWIVRAFEDLTTTDAQVSLWGRE